MNIIKSFSLNNINSAFSNNHFEIFKLSFVKAEKDITFIDKSYDKFHISIHKDGSVWLTPQKNTEYVKKRKLFEFDWNLIDREPEKEKPFIFYIPSRSDKYPNYVNINPKAKKSVFYLNSNRLDSWLLKLFIINQDTTQAFIRENDKGITIIDCNSINDGNIINTNDSFNYDNPSFIFDKHHFRFSCSKFDRTNLPTDYRALIICQPYSELNLSAFLVNYKFYIDIDTINREGFQIINECFFSFIHLCMIIY